MKGNTTIDRITCAEFDTNHVEMDLGKYRQTMKRTMAAFQESNKSCLLSRPIAPGVVTI